MSDTYLQLKLPY